MRRPTGGRSGQSAERGAPGGTAPVKWAAALSGTARPPANQHLGEPAPWPVISQRHRRKPLSGGAAASAVLLGLLIGWVLLRLAEWLADVIWAVAG